MKITDFSIRPAVFPVLAALHACWGVAGALLLLGSSLHAQSPPGVAPPIDTLRPPSAEEVGRPSGRRARFAPLPGLPLDTSFDAPGWMPQGPGLTKNGDLNIAPNHPSAGGVSSAVPHPSDASVMYIGTVNGGVWKTTNALDPNVRWKPLTDDQLSLSIGGLAMDTGDTTRNTLVAGLGRRSSLSGLGGAQRGLLRTTDGGATWTRLGETGLAGRSIYQLAVRGARMLMAVPSTDNGTLPGLYLTTDTGATYTNQSGLAGSGLPAGAVTHLAADPGTLTRFYVHVQSVGVYRSSDSGATWTNISAGMAAANVGQMALTVGPAGVLFAAELANTSRVYRSTNQGGTWTQMDSVLANTSGIFNGFAADPANSNIVYLSGLYTRANFPYSGRVVRGNASLAAGSQWVSIASTQAQPNPNANPQTNFSTAPHTDSRVLAFTAGSRLIEGDDGGIYELNIANVGTEGDGANGGGKWRSINGDLQNSEMHSMAYDPLNRIFIGGAQDAGFQEQEQPGLPVAGTPGWNKTMNGDGGDGAVDTLAIPGSTVRYGSSQFLGGFYRAVYNAANTQTSITFPATTLSGAGTAIVRSSGNVPFITPISTNAVAGNRVVISGNSNVYESLDGGTTVTQIDTGNGINTTTKIAYGGKLSGTAVPNVLFYGSGNTIRYRTGSGAVTGSVAFPGNTVQGVALDPENWKTAYITGTTTVYSANDIPANGAAAFTNITGNLTGVGTMHTVVYLTLPAGQGGNAIVVGTDIGAYLMRVATPGVWKTLGDNLPHAPVFDSQYDPVGQVLAVSTLGRGSFLYDCKTTKSPGQYGETFQAYAHGTSVLAAGAGELFSNQLGTVTRVVDDTYHELNLTADGTGGTLSAFRLPDLNPGSPITAFSAKWNATIYGDSANLADGFSFNFGPLGGITAAAFTDATYVNEESFRAGLAVSTQLFNNAGYHVRVNGTDVPGGFVSKPGANWGNFNAARHFFEVDWRMDTGLTLRVDGTAIFSNLPTPGYVPAAGHRFVFGGRTGGFDMECRLDNIAITTGGVLTPLTVAASPFYFSADFPQNSQTADKAFDGNAATKWLAQDYRGYIGAGFSSAKTIRAYTLTSGEDEPGRDLRSWDFQTGNDGVNWTQHGSQAGQGFVLRGERRAFITANPVAHSTFRVHISENAGAKELQLSEFQPWELTAVPPRFIVTNANDAGLGSLRQAVADAVGFSNATIVFISGLSGQTITLSSGPIVVGNPLGVTIDASSLPAGLTISANGSGRVFNVNTSAICSLTRLKLTGGNATGNFPFSYGGAITNQGSTTLTDCTLSGNTALRAGGAIYNQGGTLTLLRTTLSGNTTQYGGAIQNEGTVNATNSTFANNQATVEGGAISSVGVNPVLLFHCTVSANTAGKGGGYIGNGVTVQFSIVAGNTAATDPDYSGTLFIGGIAIVNQNPLLAPLGDYGGPTQTMALLPGSPARDAPLSNTRSTDQRGLPVLGTPDIGAYEAQISPIPDVTTNEQTSTGPVTFTVGQAGTFTATSSNPALIPNANLSLGGSGSSRTVTILPAANQNGTAIITLTDSTGGETMTFTVTVRSSFRVNVMDDSGPGTLRQRLIEAAAAAGPNTVTFAPDLGIITLASEIVITDPGGVTLDASNLPTGLVIDAGPGTNRHFRITPGTAATFQRLQLYGGGGTGGGTPVNYGGSILNGGTLTLRECQFMDNSSLNAAGALYNQDGLLTIERCTFANNTAASIGAVLQESQQLMTVTGSTFSNNTARFEGGALTIANFRPATLVHCTIAGNAVTQTGGPGGGGIRTSSGAGNLLTLRDCIVSGNTDANSPGVPDVATGFSSLGNNLIGGGAQLAPLGDYGGPTWTMPPMAGSPAIDAAGTSTATLDQRGVGRPLNGDNSDLALADIGAVEVPSFLTVTTRFDENDTPAGIALSLREAIRDAAAGATILFNSSFNGEADDTITLSQSLGEIAFTKGLIINASANPGGVTIDGGPGTNRIFYLPAGTGAYLNRLTLTGGNGDGTIVGTNGFGGAIYCNGGSLALTDCTLTGNSTSQIGGAINNFYGVLTLDRCLLTGNTATQEGGAIWTSTADLTRPATSSTTLTNCTLTDNSANIRGGFMYNHNGRATLLHCTLTGNTAPAGSGSGVFSYGDTLTRTTVQNCLIASNANASDVSFPVGTTNSFLSLGGNVIGSGNALTGFNQTRDTTGQTAASIRLAPLGDYGGPTQTMALRPGSPALSNATPSRTTTDQRGFGLIGQKDSGAYEAGNVLLTNYNAYIWETLPSTAINPQHDTTFDFDGDGVTNLDEFIAGTASENPSSAFRLSLLEDNGDLKISFPSITGRTYRLEQSSTLLSNSWVDSGLTPKTGNNALQNFIVTPATGPARRFYRVVVSP